METTQTVAPQTTSPTETRPLVGLTDKAAAMVKETIERELARQHGEPGLGRRVMCGPLPHLAGAAEIEEVHD